MKIEIDVEQFARDIKAGKNISGSDGTLGSLIKQLTEAALAAEIDSHLSQDLNKNRKNSYNSKTMKSDHGTFELDVPRDRKGTFEPEIVKKNQTSMTSEIEEKILSLFALGNSYSQIANPRAIKAFTLWMVLVCWIVEKITTAVMIIILIAIIPKNRSC